MEITLGPELEKALTEMASLQGVAPEELAMRALHERFLPSVPVLEPQDEWERRLLAGVKNCGVSIPNSALRREELYD